MFTKFVNSTDLHSTDKPVAIFFTYILNDGNGDFYHLKGLYEYLEEQQITQRCTVVIVIGLALDINCTLSTKIITPWLQAHNLQNFFIGDHQAIDLLFFEDTQLLKFLSKTSQIVTISTPIAVLEQVKKYHAKCPNGCLLTIIGEHEKPNMPSLGLSKGKLGLKLKRIDRISPTQFTNELQHSGEPDDQLFLNALSQESSNLLDRFHENFILIPAYFNNNDQFNSFLFFLISKPFIEKNIAIFLSGDAAKNLLIYHDVLFSQYNIRQIEVIRPFSQKTTTVIETTNGVVIQIYCGFYLSDTAYLNLFRQALIAGVLGDNGFEMAVSCRTFPFYQSTNVQFKYLTGEALCRDIMPMIPLSSQLIDAYTHYFQLSSLGYLRKIDYARIWMDEREKCISSEELVTRFSTCGDSRLLIGHWLSVADYLIEHYNFYPKFLSLFTQGLKSIQAPPSADDKEEVSGKEGVSREEYVPFELFDCLRQLKKSPPEIVDDLLTHRIPRLIKYATHFAMIINELDKEQMGKFCVIFKSYLPPLLRSGEHLYRFIYPRIENSTKYEIFQAVLRKYAADFLSECSLADLETLLQSLTSEQYRTEAYDLLQEPIVHLIHSYKDLSRITPLITPAKGAELSNRVREQISLPISSHVTTIPRQSFGFSPTLFTAMLSSAPDEKAKTGLSKAIEESNRTWTHLFDN